MDRREFLQKLGALSLLASAGKVFTLPSELSAMAPPGRPAPVLARATGTNYAHVVGDAVQALGGMKKFVQPGEVVVVKPNMAFDQPPEMAANAHPAVVRKVVELCLEAGAKKVKVLDHAGHDPRRAYLTSGIQPAVKSIRDPRVAVEFVDERRFVELRIEKARNLKRWPFYKDILEADRFINIPIAKVHSASTLTMSMKNMMGAIGGHRPNLHVNLHQNIADMNLVLRPDLHILDATRILTEGGPFGGKLEYVQIKNQVIAGTDPVAVDAYGATLFDLQPQDVKHIIKAYELGLGEMDLQKIKVVSA
jgi:uncharacterized protein (DUF362 family)